MRLRLGRLPAIWGVSETGDVPGRCLWLCLAGAWGRCLKTGLCWAVPGVGWGGGSGPGRLAGLGLGGVPGAEARGGSRGRGEGGV